MNESTVVDFVAMFDSWGWREYPYLSGFSKWMVSPARFTTWENTDSVHVGFFGEDPGKWSTENLPRSWVFCHAG